MKLTNILYCTAAMLMVTGCQQRVAEPGGAKPAGFEGLSGELDIAGGTAHIPVMEEAAKRIMKAHPGIKITIAGGGSGVGAKKVAEGLVHIGNTGRPLTDEEKAAGGGLESFAFAIDGVALVVHPGNPIADVSAAQARDIYAGKISNWKDVGGRDAAIHVFTRDEASGTRSVFWKKMLEKGPILDGANVIPSNGAMKVAISNDPGAIGYVSMGHVDDNVKALKLDGVAASQENAKSGAYPVVRRLFMNTKGKPSPLAQAFIDYLLGTDGAGICEDNGFVPIGGN